MLKNTRNLIVYHGSYTRVKDIDLKFAKKNKDFGIGFYVTSDKQQAIKFAKLIAKRYKSNKCYVNSYSINSFENLNIKEFDTTDSKWLNCVIGFRSSKYNKYAKEYEKEDVISGKIADDETSLVINAYISEAYGQVGTKQAYLTAIRLLKPNVLSDQICFKTTKAIKRLKYIEAEEINL